MAASRVAPPAEPSAWKPAALSVEVRLHTGWLRSVGPFQALVCEGGQQVGVLWGEVSGGDLRQVGADRRVSGALEDGPEGEVVTEAGAEGHTVEVCGGVELRRNCLGQLAQAGVFEGGCVEVERVESYRLVEEAWPEAGDRGGAGDVAVGADERCGAGGPAFDRSRGLSRRVGWGAGLGRRRRRRCPRARRPARGRSVAVPGPRPGTRTACCRRRWCGSCRRRRPSAR